MALLIQSVVDIFLKMSCVYHHGTKSPGILVLSEICLELQLLQLLD